MKEVEFGSLFQFIRNGMNVKQDKSGDGLPISRIETISDATIDASKVGYAGLKEEECRNWLLVPGDILFSHINSVEHVGKCAVYRGIPEKFIHGMNLLCLRCDPLKLAPDFAKYLIRSPLFRSRLSNYVNKAVNQASVSIGNLKTIRVNVPSLPEQRRIAAILDQADSLIAKRREAMMQLDHLTQSIFIEMFGDPVTNPIGWIKEPAAKIGAVITGNTPSRANSENYGNGIEWIKSDNINTPNYYLTEAKEKLSLIGKAISRIAPADAILVTCIAGSPDCIGNAAMTNREVAFNQQINAFIPRIGNSHFYYAQIIVGKKLIQEASTGGMKGMVSKGRFEKIEFIVPPCDLQDEFARRAIGINSQIVAQRKSLTELDNLFASLQFRAFRGEL